MTSITVQMEDAKAEILREKATRYGLDAEQFLMASVDNLVAQPDPDFDAAARRVLSKNQELYKRLA